MGEDFHLEKKDLRVIILYLSSEKRQKPTKSKTHNDVMTATAYPPLAGQLAQTLSFGGSHAPLKPVSRTEVASRFYSSCSDVSGHVFNKMGMNTCKKQKHEKKIPHGHSGYDLKN